MADKLKPMSEAWLRRQRVWRHNSLVGMAKMMEANCQTIIDASTTSQQTKAIAKLIQAQTKGLADSLKERIDG